MYVCVHACAVVPVCPRVYWDPKQNVVLLKHLKIILVQ